MSVLGDALGAYAETNASYGLRQLFGIQQWLFTAGALMGIISAVIVIQVASRTIKIYNRVSNYADYTQKIDAEIARLHTGSTSTQAPESDVTTDSLASPPS
jgi:hypothetical protein